jgi:hypothetical protein
MTAAGRSGQRARRMAAERTAMIMVRRLLRPVSLLRCLAIVNLLYAIVLGVQTGLNANLLNQLLIALLFFTWSVDVARVDSLRFRNDRLLFELEVMYRADLEARGRRLDDQDPT